VGAHHAAGGDEADVGDAFGEFAVATLVGGEPVRS